MKNGKNEERSLGMAIQQVQRPSDDQEGIRIL